MVTRRTQHPRPWPVRRERPQLSNLKFAPALAICLLGFTGCNGNSPAGGYDGPAERVVFKSDPWQFGADPGAVIHTEHYDLFTTIKDPDLRQYLADVMEGGFAQYHKVAPGVPIKASRERPMLCYAFGSRAEWADFTRHAYPNDAFLYLQINRGGYTVRDQYLAYDCGPAGTLSVAAHEGWHQFASRHFVGRLPPFLEEGVATMFEDIDWQNNLPRWNLTVNHSRSDSLRASLQGNYFIPLSELIRLHAGNVVALSGNRIEAFYAGAWSFAVFLWAADDGRYRPAMRAMMSDIADGTVFDPTHSLNDWRNGWNPNGVRPMLEHYLGEPFETIDGQYQKFIRKIAFEGFGPSGN